VLPASALFTADPLPLVQGGQKYCSPSLQWGFLGKMLITSTAGEIRTTLLNRKRKTTSTSGSWKSGKATNSAAGSSFPGPGYSTATSGTRSQTCRSRGTGPVCQCY